MDYKGSMTEKERSKVEKDKVIKRTETWADDQQTRGYYYDDAAGYEKYDPEAEDESEPNEDREAA